MITSYKTVTPETAFDEAKGLLLASVEFDSLSENDCLEFADAIGYEAIAAYWSAHLQSDDDAWRLVRPEFAMRVDLEPSLIEKARMVGELAVLLDHVNAAYRLGSLYTALLPSRYRSRNGIFYTPPPIVARLLSVATNYGSNWRTAKVLDPACGGGAFLVPIALRMMEALDPLDPKQSLRSIETRLRGFELHPFGAWSAQVMTEIALRPLCARAGRRLASLVHVCDSLTQYSLPEKFDLVVGNPPYGRTRLSPGLRAKYGRSLFGHANLYSLFTDLSVRLTRAGGIVSLVTPTSFLAGEYFKSLRRMLVELASPANLDFVTVRKGVFDEVLQETVLATFIKRSRSHDRCSVNVVRPLIDGIQIDRVGAFMPPRESSEPWRLPRSTKQVAVARSMDRHPYRLSDYGYEVATGQLVWNRHKEQLRDDFAAGCYPLIWAESVGPDGLFRFRAEKRNHRPYFALRSGQEWLLTQKPCVLLQRTTAKEQSRRLIAAVLPAKFLRKWEAVVVENHINIIRPATESPAVPVEMLASMLNSDILDQAFRCLSGSVAVSAYELNALPLPEPLTAARSLQDIRAGDAAEYDLNGWFAELYLDNPSDESTEASDRRRDSAAAA